MTPRFFCDTLPHPELSEPLCALGSEETRHARKVLRLSEGEAVQLFDGSGVLAEAELEGYRDGAAWCRVLSMGMVHAPRPMITVAAAVPKGSRADDMVNQLGQLGADRFVPMMCERGVVEPGAGKMERFEKVSLVSAKQSGRLTLMRVEPAKGLMDVLAEVCDVGLILDPEGGRPADMAGRLQGSQHTMLMIGPEGGFTDSELAEAEAAGFERWCIAPHVLRIETAAASALAVLRYLGGGGTI